MPRRIVTLDGKNYRFAEYDLPPLEAKEARIRVEFAAPKHGTEGHALAGSAFNRKRWDSELRMFLPLTEEEATKNAEAAATPAERGVGNMVVGTITEVGPEVMRWKVGDRVFGYGQIREISTLTEDNLWSADNLSPEDAVCVDPAHVAFVAVRDGNIRIGDDVAIFGLGAIGLLAVQCAKVSGARRVFAVDPVGIRREIAASYGAIALDPMAVDAALEIKRATENKGVDVSVETSGNGRAFQDAIRCIRQCGTIVHVPWGPKDASPLHFDQEFHLNRPTIIGSQAVWDNADRSHPLWNRERAFHTVIALFREGKLTGKGIVSPIVPFTDALDALSLMTTAPDKAVKVGVTFAAASNVRPALPVLGSVTRRGQEELARNKEQVPIPACTTSEEVLAFVAAGKAAGWSVIYGKEQKIVSVRLATGDETAGSVVGEWSGGKIVLAPNKAASGDINSRFWFVTKDYPAFASEKEMLEADKAERAMNRRAAKKAP